MINLTEIFKPQLDRLLGLGQEEGQHGQPEHVFILVYFKEHKGRHGCEVWAIEQEKIDELNKLKYLGMSIGTVPRFEAESFDHAWKLLARERWNK